MAVAVVGIASVAAAAEPRWAELNREARQAINAGDYQKLRESLVELAPLMLALAVDDKRRTLWASTGWMPQCDTCAKSDDGKTALLAFDIDSGRVIRRIGSPVPGLLGDMTISRAGDIYVSEGRHGALLYVADYLRGIAAITLATRTLTWLEPAAGVALSGIDGLVVYGDSFIAVQNGTRPARIVRMPLDLTRYEVLEASWPGLGEPTHGTLIGSRYLFTANTGWPDYDDNVRESLARRMMSIIVAEPLGSPVHAEPRQRQSHHRHRRCERLWTTRQ